MSKLKKMENNKIDKKTIELMDSLIRLSKTKIINPVAFLAALNLFLRGVKIFTRKELDDTYKIAVEEVKKTAHSDLNIGGRFHSNTYPDRMASKYNAFIILSDDRIQLPLFIIKKRPEEVRKIKNVLLEKILNAQKNKVGNLQLIDSDSKRIDIASDKDKFVDFLIEEFRRSANSFEITCFSILKIFLEKFACKLYRNSRTNARDSGIDISTDFGVVYQVKKFKIKQKKEMDMILREVQTNFDSDRIQDGKLVLVIEDISSNFRHFIVGRNIKMFKMSEIIKIAQQIDDIEDRMKVLRSIYDETRRELVSDI